MKKYAIVTNDNTVHSLGFSITTSMVAKKDRLHVVREADSKEEAKQIIKELRESPRL